MCTRSSSNPVGESSLNPTSSNPKRRNRRRSKQPFILEESLVDTMADQRTMAKLLRAPTEGYAEAWDHYKDLLCACPHHGFTELHKLDTFYNALNPADQDSLNSATGGNLLERRTQDVLTIIENKSKVRNSRNKSIVSQVKSSDANSSSSFEIAKLTHACLAADGNTFLEFRDNIQGYVSVVVVNYNQVVPLSQLEKIKKMNKINIKAMQTQINNVKNKLRNEMKTSIQASMYNQTNKLKNMMASFFQMNTASTSGLGPLPSNTIANPKEETLTDQDLAVYTIKVPPPLVQKAKPPSQINYVVHERDPLHPNILYPSRMYKQKQQDKDEIQIHKFWKMFKQLHINITLADALILTLKYQNMLKALLSNKEKLLEQANTPLNENCSAVILKKLHEKLKDPGKFLIMCGFSGLKCKALADLGASINLMPLSVWKKLGLPELISTRMTLELANRAICTPAGIVRDVFVLVGNSHSPLILSLLIMRAIPDTTSSFPDHFLEEFAYELALITFPLGNYDLPFDIKSDLREIEYLLNHDPTKEMDSILEDSVDECNLADPNDNLVDTIPKMFTDKHTLIYSSPPLYDDFDDDLFEHESNNDDVYNDPFDSKEDKIKESKLLIDELDLPRSSDFLPSPEYDSFLFEDFSEVDVLPSTDNEDKVFNLGILIQENLSELIV
uniref:Reverse transcriptase domain-containing protein n=1 Tax=Tanacetum cinerariifolium TaxID=118510 RepID=A0A6L2KH92_TANCI|nr:hypothetical protein [Tanacetum cinerariifolium]